MAHDSYSCEKYTGMVYPFLSQRRPGKGNFVGAVIEDEAIGGGKLPLTWNYECPKKCRPRTHAEWRHC